MRDKLPLLFVSAFFVTMNVLLWRSEFGSRSGRGTPLPAETVWEKVLTSPDHSSLEIRHKGVKIGRANWSARINESPVALMLNTDEVPPEGMIKSVTGYSLDCDGTLSLEDLTRLKVDFHLNLATNQAWQELNIKVALRPASASWEFHASATNELLRFVANEGDGVQERQFKFSELQDPQKLAQALGGPFVPVILAATGMPVQQARPSTVALGLKWEASQNTLKVGRNSVRVYRLEARLFDRFKAVLFVSPVGELLRVELPNDILLINEALISL